MKTIKFLLIACAFFIANTGFSYTLRINKTFLSHNPAHEESDYKFTKRLVSYEMNAIDPNQIDTKIVDIFCEGNGSKICPNQIAIPTEPVGPPTFMTVAGVNAAQGLFDTAIGNYLSTGSMTNTSGTVMTPDGLYYTYAITWTSSIIGGDQILMTFSNI